LARKHVGALPQWRIGLDKLAAKVGTPRPHAFSSATCFASQRSPSIPMRGCERPGDLLGAIQTGSMQRQDTEDYRAARFNLHVAATRAKWTVNIMTPQHDPSPLLP
jgi:hypothetical protein